MREAVSHLSTDDATALLEKLSASLRRRKYQLVGYLVAAIAGFLGFVVALIVYVMHEPGTFVGWVFIIPFAGIGLSLFVFGKLADRIGASGLVPVRSAGSTPSRTAPATSKDAP